jgi:hypothetical protein
MAHPEVTVDDAVAHTLGALESRDSHAEAERLRAAYPVLAGTPVSRLRVPNLGQVAALMSEIQHDDSMESAERHAASNLYLLIGSCWGTIDPQAAEPDAGVPVDHEGNTYRLDSAGVLHFEVRNENNLVIHRLRIRVVPSEDGEPPTVAIPGWRSGHSRVVDDPDLGRTVVSSTEEEREYVRREAQEAVNVAYYELHLWDGRDI